MILLDTDHLSVLTDRRAAGNSALFRRLELAGEPIAIPIVAVEEQCKGWLAKLNRTRDIHQQIAPYERLAGLFDFPTDLKRVETEINRLDNQALVRYYDAEWRKWD